MATYVLKSSDGIHDVFPSQMVVWMLYRYRCHVNNLLRRWAIVHLRILYIDGVAVTG